MERVKPTLDSNWVNLGAIFAEHLVSLKNKPFKGTWRKKDTIWSLLTPIFSTLGISHQGASVVSDFSYMDEVHLTSANWLKEGRFWYFVDDTIPHLIELLQRSVTYLDNDVTRLEFHPDRFSYAPHQSGFTDMEGYYMLTRHRTTQTPLRYLLPISHSFHRSLRSPSTTMVTSRELWLVHFKPYGPE